MLSLSSKRISKDKRINLKIEDNFYIFLIFFNKKLCQIITFFHYIVNQIRGEYIWNTWKCLNLFEILFKKMLKIFNSLFSFLSKTKTQFNFY